MRTLSSPGTHSSRGWISVAIVAMIGVAFSANVISTLLSESDWNPTALVKFGELGPEQEYGAKHFDELVLAVDNGHDGKFYFIQATDPFFLEPDVNAAYLDRPSYRAQRMLYPTVAGGFGLFSSEMTAWAMILVNLVAIGFGTVMTSLLARSLGISVFFGLAFALNPGVFVSSFIDSAEVFATAFLFAALYFVVKRRMVWASAMMTLSVLSRETMVVAAIGVVIYLWRIEKPVSPVWLSPFLLPGFWWGYVHLRIGYLDAGVQDTAAVGLPFRGFVEAMQFWVSNPGHFGDLAAGVLLMLVAIAVLIRTIRDRSLLGFASVGFSLIAFVMVKEVWGAYFDSTRVLAPLLTAYVLMVPASVEMSRREWGSPRSEPSSELVSPSVEA